MDQDLHIYNSLSGKKEKFTAIKPPFVGMYVCGPTVYNHVHLGNLRTFTSFDVIYRYLSYLGYKVRYVRNITDAGHLENDADEGEDKIAKRARIEELEPMEIVQQYTVGFHRIMEQFNNLPPSIEPTATGHIVEQIEMVKSILDRGLAYEVNGSVYFDVKKYMETEPYGEVSGRNVDDLLSGTRTLDGQDEKRNPLDFALWKKALPEHIMRWPSPWSVGFPGWHLECSVMSTKYLGEEFDIHGGGMDLKFPHHECELAQCKASHGKDSVKYWMHANMLTLNGKRMSKSTGNTLLPQEIFSGENDLLHKAYSPAVVRFFMLQAHYRSTLDISDDALEAAEKGHQRFMQAVALLPELPVSSETNFSLSDFKNGLFSAMNDDFNAPMVIAQLFEGVRIIHKIQIGEIKITVDDKKTFRQLIEDFAFSILGLHQTKKGEQGNEKASKALDSAMKILIDLRNQARKDKNFALSDQIRDQLHEAGVHIQDGKDGTQYTIS